MPPGPGWVKQSRTETATHLAAGREAEALAETHLHAHGLQTVARNFRCRYGELDLVMQDGPELVVVEIRYRRRPVPVAPAETVTARKRTRIVRAAADFLQRYPRYDEYPVRFDVVAVSGLLNAPHVQWLQSAFDCHGCD